MQESQARLRRGEGQVSFDRGFRPRPTRTASWALFVAATAFFLIPNGHAIPGKSGVAPLYDAVRTTPSAAKTSGGVGMVLDGRNGRIVVARVVPGGPAARAGVKQGDVVLTVDGVAIPAGARVAKVAGMVRGPVGAVAALGVQRNGGTTPLVLRIRRGDLSQLFPKRASAVLIVEPGLSLIATSGRWSVGVTFPRGGAQADLLTYQWAIVPAGQKLSHAKAQRGLGAVAWGRGGATVQVADWRLDLRPWPARGRLIVSGSNLPLATVAAEQWVEADPATARYVRPRSAPRSYRTTWPTGSCTLRMHAQRDGKDAANHRLTLRITNLAGQARPSATVQTDDSGHALLRLPPGSWTINGLHPSLSGAKPDLYYAASLPASVATKCAAGKTVDVTLTTKSPAPSWVSGDTSLPATAFQHALVGRPLPKILVKEWLGGTNPLPKTLKGKVMLVYLWATWCGPCKRVSPMMAELHARLARRGLVVVPTSVDRDRLALQDYVEAESSGAAPVAWVGPQPLAKLPIRGIPTVVAIDDEGIVRAVHTGTGVGVDTWTKWLGERLDEAQGKRPRTRIAPPKVVAKPKAKPKKSRRKRAKKRKRR